MARRSLRRDSPRLSQCNARQGMEADRYQYQYGANDNTSTIHGREWCALTAFGVIVIHMTHVCTPRATAAPPCQKPAALRTQAGTRMQARSRRAWGTAQLQPDPHRWSHAVRLPMVLPGPLRDIRLHEPRHTCASSSYARPPRYPGRQTPSTCTAAAAAAAAASPAPAPRPSPPCACRPQLLPTCTILCNGSRERSRHARSVFLITHRIDLMPQPH
jgi:hypothetical protein